MRIATTIQLLLLIYPLLCLVAGCDRQTDLSTRAAARPKSAAFTGTIVAVGNSLTAGLGVNEEEASPALLENKLRSAGYQWRVINAGISGETSSGALARITWVLKLKPDIVILETGANDGLRGVDPRLILRNIDEIVSVFKENKVTVVLAGMRMLTNMGSEYTRAFAAVFPAIASKHGLVLIPFFLEGVAGEPDLNQADGLHPTAEGYRLVAETVYPYVVKAIDQRQQLLPN